MKNLNQILADNQGLIPQQPQQLQVEWSKTSETERCELARTIFWKHLRKRAQKELKADFVIDDENRQQVSAFVAYFSNNEDRMRELEIDPRKGIILIGNPGSGKSILFRTLRDVLESRHEVEIGGRKLIEARFFKRCNLYTCEHMAKLFMAKGEAGLEHFSKGAVHRNGRDKVLKHACFDDLGAEELRNVYGNKKEVMVDIIQERYDLFLEHGLLTHFTSNLNPQEIENRYSSRIRSRIRQMCNVIQLGASENYKDRR